MRPYLKKAKAKKGLGGVSQMEEHLHSKSQTLSSTSSTTRKKKNVTVFRNTVRKRSLKSCTIIPQREYIFTFEHIRLTSCYIIKKLNPILIH
jgi:hypothetical protein